MNSGSLFIAVLYPNFLYKLTKPDRILVSLRRSVPTVWKMKNTRTRNSTVLLTEFADFLALRMIH